MHLFGAQSENFRTLKNCGGFVRCVTNLRIAAQSPPLGRSGRGYLHLLGRNKAHAFSAGTDYNAAPGISRG